MHILLADSLPETIILQLEKLRFEVSNKSSLEGASLLSYIRDTNPEILVVRSTKVSAEMLQTGSISLVLRAGAGVNNIDVEVASQLGIYVANCPGKNAIAVAELVMGHIIALDRHIVDATVDLRNGIWNKKKYSKAQGLYGRTLGLIGVGNIAKEVIVRAHGFGMKTLAWSRSLSPETAERLHCSYASSIEEVAAQSDILSIHLALTSETRNMIGDVFFKAMKPNSYLINTARGELIDEEALIRACNEKHIKLGADVWHKQPSPTDIEFKSALISLPNVCGTHHIGASTEQSQQAVAEETLRILAHFKKEGQVLNCVNIQDEQSQHALVIRHKNKVGVLASILGYIRAEKVNILEMQNTLFYGEAAACATIHINNNPKPTLIKKIEDIEAIISVQLV